MAFAKVPRQGTQHNDILPVVGIFYSEQGHLQHMRARLEG